MPLRFGSAHNVNEHDKCRPVKYFNTEIKKTMVGFQKTVVTYDWQEPQFIIVVIIYRNFQKFKLFQL